MTLLESMDKFPFKYRSKQICLKGFLAFIGILLLFNTKKIKSLTDIENPLADIENPKLGNTTCADNIFRIKPDVGEIINIENIHLPPNIIHPPVKPEQGMAFNVVVEQYEKKMDQPNYEHKTAYEKLYKDNVKLHFGDAGRKMLDNIIKSLCVSKGRKILIVMEVGVWLGHSVARWLKVDPKVRVVAFDPFTVPETGNPWFEKVGISDKDQKHFGNSVFNRGLAKFNVEKQIKEISTNRALVIEGFFPEAGNFFFDAYRRGKGPQVDVFYLDGGKVTDPQKHMSFVNNTLTKVLNDFPSAIIAGDDWSHGTHKELFQKTVANIAMDWGRNVYVSDESTWMMA